MSKRVKDISGMKFGRLTVICRGDDYITHKGSKTICWLCKCECGNTITTRGTRLKSGYTKSCGCLKQENDVFKSGSYKGNLIHGLSKKRLYTIWRSMKERCLSTTAINYGRYGARGITICDEWKSSVVPFYNWSMENGYDDNLSIDRIDNDRGYSPSNCRWVANYVQQRNKRNNHYLTLGDNSITITDFSKMIGIDQKCIRRRLEKGFTPDEIYKELKA